MVGHFHHDATIRLKKWDLFSNLCHKLTSANFIWLCDFNSVFLQERDVSYTHTTLEHTTVLAARDQEIRTLSLYHAVDSFAVTHLGRLNDLPWEGWTWGFPSVTPPPPPPTSPPSAPPRKKQRRPGNRSLPQTAPNVACDNHVDSDRHRLIRDYLQPCIVGYFPKFLADSDHKIITLQLGPHLPPPSVKRKRCPATFVDDADAVDKI